MRRSADTGGPSLLHADSDSANTDRLKPHGSRPRQTQHLGAPMQLGRIRCQKVWAAMTTSAARVRAGQQAERSWLARSCPQH